MPSKAKLSPKARLDAKTKDNKVHLEQAKIKLASSNIITSSDGVTKIFSNFYMVNSDGDYFMRVTEKRSAKVNVMKWSKIS
jgi:hypothetical protein